MSNQEVSEVGPNGGLTIPDHFSKEQVLDYRASVVLADKAIKAYGKQTQIARSIAEAATNGNMHTSRASVWAEGRNVEFDQANNEFLFLAEVVTTLMPPRWEFERPKSNQPFAETVKRYPDDALANMVVTRLMPEHDVSDRTQRTYTIGALALMDHLVSDEYGPMKDSDRVVLNEFLARVATNADRQETVGSEG
jgi:hypothetical protein